MHNTMIAAHTRRLSIDWYTFGLITLLCLLGLAFILSATYRTELMYSTFFKKQIIGVISGLCIYIICSLMDVRLLLAWGHLLYASVIALLIFTILKGSIGMGAQRWINLGIIKMQPSELTKLFFPFFAGYYLYHSQEHPRGLLDFMPILGMLGVSFILIVKQPDLGTAILISAAGALSLWLAGLDRRIFLYSIVFGLIGTPLLWNYLKPYQQQRVRVFLGHGNSNKERYQIEQSKIAIGSGALLGKGYLQGTQNRLNFLPESRTDFIFSVICEELGFLGALGVLTLYTLLFMRLFYLAAGIKSHLLYVVAIGLISPIILGALINIAMVTDLLPIVGIPLPFISYGLSNLWVACAGLGWFNSIIYTAQSFD